MTRRKRYSVEFKREALRRANEDGATDTLVAEELGFSTRQLRRWREEAKNQFVVSAFGRNQPLAKSSISLCIYEQD